ncbi:MAG: hypothetical protein GY793_02020 [Proteobacteria bacterium]|nr:hypothetical protein [Pseudomonadota bacterium]
MMDITEQFEELICEKKIDYDKIKKFITEQELTASDKIDILNMSVYKENIELIKYLLKNDIKVNIDNDSNHPIFNVIIQKKTQPNKEFYNNALEEFLKPTDHNVVDGKGNNLLHYTAKDVELTKIVLKYASTKHNTKNEDDKAPIHIAAKDQNSETFKMLLKKTDPYILDNNNNNLIHIALNHDLKPNIINDLIEKTDINPNTKNKNKEAAIHVAIQNNNFEAFELLLEHTNHKILDGDKSNLLHHIAEHANDPDFIEKALEDTNIDPNVKNKDGETPIQTTIKKTNFEAFKILLKYTNHKILDAEGNNLLHYTAEHTYTQNFIEEIVEKTNINPNTKNEDGEAPVHTVIKEDDFEIFKTLLKHTSHKILDKQDNTLLHYSAKHHQKEAVLYIMQETNIDHNALNADNMTAFEIAREKKFHDLHDCFKNTEYWKLSNDNSVKYTQLNKKEKTELSMEFNFTVGIIEINKKDVLSKKDITKPTIIDFNTYGRKHTNKAQKQFKKLKKEEKRNAKRRELSL